MKLESQEANLAQTQLEFNKLKVELKEKQNLISELEEMLSLAPSNMELSALKESLSLSKDAAAELQNAKQDFSALKDQLNASQQDARELQESQETISTQLEIVERTSSEKDSEIKSLRDRLSEQAALENMVAEQKTEILSLEESLSELHDSGETSRLDLENLNQQLTDAQKALEKVNAEANATNELLGKAKRETLQMKEENVSLKQVVSKQREESDRVRAQQHADSERITELEIEVKQYKTRLEEPEHKRSIFIDQKVKLEEALDNNVEFNQQKHSNSERLVELDEVSKTNAVLKLKVSELEQEIASSRVHESGSLEETLSQSKHSSNKLDALSQTDGQLEASVNRTDLASEELKKIVEAQKLRIQELEQSAAASSGLATRQSDAAEQSRKTLLNIEETLRQQMNRMNYLEKINEQSLAKISELQSAPISRRSPRKKIPDGHEDLSQINGIGPKFRQNLFDHGVKTIQEIASWSNEDAKTFAEKLGCGERTTTRWIEKADEIVRRNPNYRPE